MGSVFASKVSRSFTSPFRQAVPCFRDFGEISWTVAPASITGTRGHMSWASALRNAGLTMWSNYVCAFQAGVCFYDTIVSQAIATHVKNTPIVFTQ